MNKFKVQGHPSGKALNLYYVMITDTTRLFFCTGTSAETTQKINALKCRTLAKKMLL